MRETPAAYRVSDMEANDRPRERLAEVGAENLSTAELLAILLRTGLPGENVVALAGRLLKDMGGLSGLHRSSLQELRDQHGLGLAKATQIKAAIELGRRLASEKPEDRPAITSPRDVADIVKYEMSAFTQEHLWVIVLDTRNRVMHIERLYKGSLNLAMVRVAEVLKPPSSVALPPLFWFTTIPAAIPPPVRKMSPLRARSGRPVSKWILNSSTIWSLEGLITSHSKSAAWALLDLMI